MESLTHTHPNVHTPWQQWSEEQTLHVASVYFNPLRFETRRKATNNFIQRMKEMPNVRLYMTEIAFGDRPYELPNEPDVVRLRTNDVMWFKENATNIAVSRFAPGWQYGAAVDCDFNFTRRDWALETVHQLQHHPWLQPYSSYAFMSSHHQPTRLKPSFSWVFHERHSGDAQQHMAVRSGEGLKKNARVLEYSYDEGGSVNPSGHHHRELIGSPGGAWAFTKKGFENVGGFLDFSVLGAGDWYMAFGFIGCRNDRQQAELRNQPPAYTRAITAWQDRAYRAVKANIGFVDCMATHDWHGCVTKRGYGTRWQILRANNFDPATDLVRDSQGLWRWAGNKPQLEAQVRRYFRSRDEDSTELRGGSML